MLDNLRYFWENLDKKKFFLIAAIVIAVIVLGYIIYAIWRPAPAPLINTNQPGAGGFPATGPGGVNVGETGQANLPPTGQGEQPVTGGGAAIPLVAAGGNTLTKVLSDNSTSFPAATSAAVRYYDSATCQFYELSPTGSKKSLSSDQYCNVQKATWSPGTSSAVLEFPDGSNVVYDFKSKKQYSLPREMENFSWSPDGNKIAGKYMGNDIGDRWVVAVNSDGSALRGVEPMGDNADKVDVEWSPNNQVVALSRTGEPSGAFTQQVLLVGFNQENFKGLYIDGRGFEPKWTPDGKRLLYSVFSDKTGFRPSLWLVDGTPDRAGLNKQNLNLGTWADKCNLIGTYAYCAVPTDLPEGAGLVRELANGVPDSVWRIDLTTGATNLLATPVSDDGKGLSVTSLTASADGNWVYFTDSEGKLRSLKLKE